jgi:rRNA biogenesis protein RRP5
MALTNGGKTRTTSAHAPISSKKAFKAPDNKKPLAAKPRPTTSSASTSTPATGTKRKAEDDRPAAEKPAVASSLLNAPEEIDFPRGGGTNLTQVEVREAQLEGEKEARDEENVSIRSGVRMEQQLTRAVGATLQH